MDETEQQLIGATCAWTQLLEWQDADNCGLTDGSEEKHHAQLRTDVPVGRSQHVYLARATKDDSHQQDITRPPAPVCHHMAWTVLSSVRTDVDSREERAATMYEGRPRASPRTTFASRKQF
jgi:hypothetical protein